MKKVPILVVLLLLAAAAAFGVQHLASDRATSESAEAADGEIVGDVEAEGENGEEGEEEDGGPQKPADYLTL